MATANRIANKWEKYFHLWLSSWSMIALRVYLYIVWSSKLLSVNWHLLSVNWHLLSVNWHLLSVNWHLFHLHLLYFTLKYILPLTHCSDTSITMADTNLKQDSSLANILATLVRCLTVWLSRSIILLVLRRFLLNSQSPCQTLSTPL